MKITIEVTPEEMLKLQNSKHDAFELMLGALPVIDEILKEDKR